MLGYVCQYYNNKGQEYQNIISYILQQLNSTSIQNGLISTESLFKLSTGSKNLDRILNSLMKMVFFIKLYVNYYYQILHIKSLYTRMKIMNMQHFG